MEQQHVFKLGNSTIVANGDEFGEGYTNGVLGSSDQEQPWTVEVIRNIIVEGMTDTYHTEDWNTGYIVGAIRGIYEGDCKQKDEPCAPRVQFGSVTLHLNRWRFRDGYYNGRQDYEVSRHQQAATGILTACELLSYIAHRDPETNMYYFGEDEFSALEDVLGQFVGYLCTALFPKLARENDTGPLHLATLQEA